MSNPIPQAPLDEIFDKPTPTQNASDGVVTPAQARLLELKLAVNKLPIAEQREFDFVCGRLDFFLAKYQSSAALAIVSKSLEIGVQQGQ
jgi:hypothetical protein